MRVQYSSSRDWGRVGESYLAANYGMVLKAVSLTILLPSLVKFMRIPSRVYFFVFVRLTS